MGPGDTLYNMPSLPSLLSHASGLMGSGNFDFATLSSLGSLARGDSSIMHLLSGLPLQDEDLHAKANQGGNHEPQSYLSFLQSADQLRQELPVLANPWAEAAKESFHLPTSSIAPSPRFSNPVGLNNLLDLPQSPFNAEEAVPSQSAPVVHSSQLVQVSPRQGHQYGGPRDGRIHHGAARVGRGEALGNQGPSFMTPHFFSEASMKELMKAEAPAPFTSEGTASPPSFSSGGTAFGPSPTPPSPLEDVGRSREAGGETPGPAPVVEMQALTPQLAVLHSYQHRIRLRGDGGNANGQLEVSPRKPVSCLPVIPQRRAGKRPVPIPDTKVRSSQYRGVTKHRRSGRWEAHVWVKELGRQVYLGGYEREEHAAEAYDVAVLKCKGRRVATNFEISRYADLLDCMDTISLEELIMAVRRQSQGFARGTSTYRGVTHHPSGRWEARIGIPGSKHIYLGLFTDELQAARAYDAALVRLRGTAAATNFALSEYRADLAAYHQMQQMVLQSHEPSADVMAAPYGGGFEEWIKNGTQPDPYLVPIGRGSPSLSANHSKRKASRHVQLKDEDVNPEDSEEWVPRGDVGAGPANSTSPMTLRPKRRRR